MVTARMVCLPTKGGNVRYRNGSRNHNVSNPQRGARPEGLPGRLAESRKLGVGQAGDSEASHTCSVGKTAAPHPYPFTKRGLIRISLGFDNEVTNRESEDTKMKKNEGVIMDLDVVLPAEGQKPTIYADFLLKLQSKTRFFDRNLGYISWLQGKVLNMARNKCKRGEWGPFVGSIDVGDRAMTMETAQKLMKIANHIVESQAKIKSYSDMLKMVYPSYAKELREDAKATESALHLGKKNRRKGGKGASNKPLHPETFQKNLNRLLSSTFALFEGRS